MVSWHGESTREEDFQEEEQEEEQEEIFEKEDR